MSYIGIIGAQRLDKHNPSLGLIEAYQKALSLHQAGQDMRTVKIKTGWELGVDDLWRYEVADPFHTTEKIEDYIKRHFGESINIRACMHDTQLLVAYPELEHLRLFALYSPQRRWAGYFSSDDYAIMVCLGTARSPFEYQTEGLLLHEVQHLIQEREGFAQGGGSRDPGYLYLAGEVEARNICHRHNLTSEERKRSLRVDTQDVPDEVQIIRLKSPHF